MKEITREEFEALKNEVGVKWDYGRTHGYFDRQGSAETDKNLELKDGRFIEQCCIYNHWRRWWIITEEDYKQQEEASKKNDWYKYN